MDGAGKTCLWRFVAGSLWTRARRSRLLGTTSTPRATTSLGALYRAGARSGRGHHNAIGGVTDLPSRVLLFLSGCDRGTACPLSEPFFLVSWSWLMICVCRSAPRGCFPPGFFRSLLPGLRLQVQLLRQCCLPGLTVIRYSGAVEGRPPHLSLSVRFPPSTLRSFLCAPFRELHGKRLLVRALVLKKAPEESTTAKGRRRENFGDPWCDLHWSSFSMA